MKEIGNRPDNCCDYSAEKLSIRFIEHPAWQATITDLCNQVWQNLLDWLSNSEEIKVKQKYDRAGNPYWYAYNPRNGQTMTSSSETEIRMWLEQQLYY